MKKHVQLIRGPFVSVLASQALDWAGVAAMAEWVADYAPECLPEGLNRRDVICAAANLDYGLIRRILFPHDDEVTDNELLVELAGRKCYNSFGARAGRKSNEKYIANLFGAPDKIPHASVLYHAKMTFFFAGVGRRVSHEIIRNYVGADRDEEGAPSQESTRYTHHPGFFTVHPRDVEQGETAIEEFRRHMQSAYDDYCSYLNQQIAEHEQQHGESPKGMDRKRIYECAAQRLPGAAATSFVWTTNPIAASKFFRERCDFAADLEIQRFAQKWRSVCYARWPHLFAESNSKVVA